MTRFLPVLGLSLTALALPQLAAAQTVTLAPGLYDYAHVVSIGGMALPADESEYCIAEGDNSKTLDELVASLAGDGECTVSNVNMTGSTGRADLSCTDTDLGMDISGTLTADYGPDFYNVDTRASLGPMQVLVRTEVRRRGECPANWGNPDDITPE